MYERMIKKEKLFEWLNMEATGLNSSIAKAAYVSKAKLKPVNASRLQNQNTKDSQSQTANQALS